jgi:alpha-tubulin suppressor-like RCC1 family protein
LKHRGLPVVFSLLAAAGACNRGPGVPLDQAGRPPVLQLQIILPPNFASGLVATADVVLSSAGAEAIPFAAVLGVGGEVNGVPYSIRTQDADRDGRREFVVSFAQNPFGERTTATFYLAPQLSTDGGAFVSAPIRIDVLLYDRNGADLATGEATIDTAGQPIRLGDTDRLVQVLVSCVPGAACDTREQPLPPGKGSVRLSVSRARDCPDVAALGDLYVYLLPGPGAPPEAHTVSSTVPGLSFADPQQVIEFNADGLDPSFTVVEGPYLAYAVLDVGQDIAAGGPTTPTLGDFVSDAVDVQVLSGLATTARLVLNRVVGVAACSGGSAQVPEAPRLTSTEPASPANNNRPLVLGTADPGALVRIHTDLECRTPPVAEGTATDSGAFQIAVPVADNATTVFSATAVNSLGLRSPCSVTRLSYVEDSIEPAPPVDLACAPPSPADESRPILSGSAEAGATIGVFRDVPCTGSAETTVVANAVGLFSVSVQVTENSTTTFFFQARDDAGNVSACSAGLTYVEDSRVPAVPTLETTTPTSPSNSNTPSVQGTADPGVRVQIFVDPACAAKLGEGLADAFGLFSVPVNVADNTTTSFFARAVSLAGKESDCSLASLTYVEDSTPPPPPTLLFATPPSPSSALTPTITGGSEPGARIRVYATPDCTGAVVGTATTSDFGSFSAVASGVTRDGITRFAATAEDRAGNVGGCSAALPYQHDSQAPTFGGAQAASGVSASQITVSWAAATDSVTAPASLVYEVCRTAEPDGCVNQFTASEVTPPGVTSFTMGGLAEGTRYYFVVRARDEAGNLDRNTSEVSAKTLSSRAVAMVASGLFHTCALLSSGLVRCWGQNSDGQLGDGTTETRLTPVAVKGLENVTAIAARKSHTCALLANGTVRCWGKNSYGQLGDGTTNPSPAPVAVSGVTKAVAIAVGDEHSCAVLGSGSGYCWGRNDQGQLGNGTTSTQPQTTPVQIVLPSAPENLRLITAGAQHTCALRADSTVVCSGSNEFAQVGNNTGPGGNVPAPATVLADLAGTPPMPLTGVVAVAAGAHHTCTLLGNGEGRCWGRNDLAQLANNSTEGAPSKVAISVGSRQMVLLESAVGLAAGEHHTCAVLAGGSVSCWGYNASRQLGDRTTQNQSQPVTVLNLVNAIGVAAGASHTCGLRADGTARCWGDNTYGQLGNGTTTARAIPAQVLGLTGAASGLEVAVGGSHACGLVSDARMRCWGRNSSGQLGDGTADSRARAAEVTNLPEVAAVALGANHSCALLAEGSVRCWGYNGMGQVGDGSSGNNRLVPTPVSGLQRVYSVAAGGSHTCALSYSIGGSIASCWGQNTYGQLGNTLNTDSPIPVQVVAVSTSLKSLALGASHSCVLYADGTLRCWGFGQYGQLGMGRLGNAFTPEAVVAGPSQQGILTNNVAVRAGAYHTCSLRPVTTTPESNVLCWGLNNYGQLGDGTTTMREAPVAVPGLSNALALATGHYHTCALLSDGTARCWGLNTSGQLGNGEVASAPPYGSLTPVAVAGLTNAVGLAAGGSSTCALLADGTARCWGSNSSGQLGLADPMVRSTATPVPVDSYP